MLARCTRVLGVPGVSSGSLSGGPGGICTPTPCLPMPTWMEGGRCERQESQAFGGPWKVGTSPTGPLPPQPEHPARHTPDLNGQPAVEGRQCLDRTQFLIRAADRTGLGWGWGWGGSGWCP